MGASSRFAASGLLALCLAPAAYAGDELYLRWDNCFGDGGVYNKVFACDTNSGSDVIVGSFRLAQTMDMSAIDGAVHVIPFGGGVPPSWWQYVRTGSCRKNSLVVSFAAPPISTACLDPWGGSPAVQGAFDYTNGAIIKYVAGVSAPLSFTLPAGQEFVAFQARIDHALTTGPAACGGCSSPVCIAWEQATVSGPAGTVSFYGAEIGGHDWNVTWQPGGVTTVDPFDGTVGCQSVTPARASTWGSIKSLYRR